jgi:hypothetical protein
VVQLLKQVRMPSSTIAPVGVIFLVGGDGGGFSQSIVFGGKPQIRGRPPLMPVPMGVVALVGGVKGTSWIG